MFTIIDKNISNHLKIKLKSLKKWQSGNHFPESVSAYFWNRRQIIIGRFSPTSK